MQIHIKYAMNTNHYPNQPRGIVPITCDQLFKTISENTDPNKVFEDNNIINNNNILLFLLF